MESDFSSWMMLNSRQKIWNKHTSKIIQNPLGFTRDEILSSLTTKQQE